MTKQKTTLTSRFCCFFVLLNAALLFIIGPSVPLLASDSRPQPAALSIWLGYFPLDTGNRWVYSVQGPGFSSHFSEVKVKGEKSTGHFRSHFELSGYLGGKEPRLVRNTMFGTVLEVGDDGKEYLWYDFGRRVGKSWVMELAKGDGPVCEDGAKLTVGARDEEVTVPAGEFRHVVRLDFMTKCSDAGITREWFAPGVGLIRREQASFGGPIISELIYAEVGGRILPSLVYSTALRLSRSRYTNNLMPPVDPSRLPRVTGVFIVRDETDTPGELVFPTGCQGLLLEVRNDAGVVVRTIDTLEGVTCAAVVSHFDLGEEALVVPFSFKLADKDGKPLPDGAYSITAVLQTGPGHDTLRPTARAYIQVKSVQ